MDGKADNFLGSEKQHLMTNFIKNCVCGKNE